ncbi:MAG: hypothetical protein KDK70_22445, partial [Myxococcales bacterium]|nr:hypothetical protein [Myxococcales bacterium]
MRIDLEHSPTRPLPMRVGMRVAGAIVGLVPGPLLVMSYRPALFDERLRRYVLRAAGYEGPWSKGESELFAAFVSNLNA